LTIGEYGPNTPKRRDPLASGGRTKGIITTILKRNLPGKLLNLAKKYDKGIPTSDKSSEEMVAEARLRINALPTCGRDREFNNFIGSRKIKIDASG
jgi:hypothetical protein